MSTSPARAFVVGMGEVGRRLAAALAAGGLDVRPVTRDSGWGEALADGGGAVIVAVREEALEEVLARTAAVPTQRLVFVQNGWIRPLLAGRPGCTRGLIWFTSKGEFFRVLRPSVLAGPLAPALARALGRGGIAAEVAAQGRFAAAEAEKMAFNCVVGLPLAVHRVTLAEYLAGHGEEAQEVFREAAQVTARALGVEVPGGTWRRFLRFTRPIGWLRASAPKALEFRNGAVVRLARERGIATPANARLLAAVGFAA
jgi:ketopantoate reductase